MATVSILIAARAAAAAAIAQARAQIGALGRAVADAARRNTAYNRTVRDMSGTWRDANGRLRDAHGRFVGMNSTLRTSTTTLGRIVDVMEGFTTSMIRSAPAVAALGAKMAALLATVLPLIGALANLIPLVQLIAPAAGAAGLAMLTMKLAMNGVSEALQAGLSGDTEAFEKALKKLEPAAANAVRQLVKLRDQWKPLQQRVQGEIFAGVAGELEGLSQRIKPVAERWLPRLAMRIAETRNKLATGLANFAADGRLEAVWRNLHVALSDLLDTVPVLGRVFGDVLEVASPRFAKIAGYIKDAVTAFGDWIRAAKESGKLGEWLDKAMETFGKLKDIGLQVGRIIGAIFKASGDEGDGMLDQIEAALTSIADWANSGDGQAVIDFFAGVFAWLGKVAPLFDLWAKYFAGISVAAKAAWDFISEALRFAVNLWVSYLGAMVTAAAKAFGWIPGIGPKLKQAAAEFEEYKNRVNRSLDGIQDEVVNITYHVREVRSGAVTHAKGGGLQFNAHGGNAALQRIVGDRGPEIVDFTRGMVYNSNETKRAKAAAADLASGGGRGATVLVLESVRADSLARAVAALFGAAMESGQLRMSTDDGRSVSLVGR